MSPNAIRQASARLLKVQQALSALDSAHSFDDIESAWVDFIQSVSTIYNKLEQGSKSNGKSVAWFGRVKHVRRKDPLLSYIHHARDSDQHGIRDLTRKKNTEYLVDMPKGHPFSFVTGFVVDADAEVGEIEIGDGINPPTFITPTRKDIADLVTVYDDAHKDRFEPPVTHLGRSLPDIRPITVAKLAFTYISSLIEDAESYSDG